jgi:NADPH2:quinone reductase
MLQGMTAHYLSASTYPLKSGDTALVHAAAGGVGLVLIQMAKRAGARVFGAVFTQEKARLAREAGADEVILYTEQDFQQEVRRMTDSKGVQVVYDSVGQTTFMKSLDSLAPPFDAALLAQKGSLYLTRPSLAQYALMREELLWRAGDVLNWITTGELKLRIEKTFPLSEAAEAHRQLEGWTTIGKILLLP